MTDHGIVAPLDNFLGCHDLSSFPDLGIVGAACGEQAQVWEINRWTGLPNTSNPKWSYDQPNVDFWHSATFSWDGKVANFIDESFGDSCPTVTTKTAGLPGPPKVLQVGQHVLLRDQERRAAVGVPQPAADQRHPQPRQRRRRLLLLAPRHPGARRSTATCWSTPTTAAARR